ncbi:MAG: hypothetical protein HY779_04755, partial [Rubrobacteridae bacterium]|nr:hypothetical protein [Rubrobacteridae bacterium]
MRNNRSVEIIKSDNEVQTLRLMLRFTLILIMVIVFLNMHVRFGKAELKQAPTIVINNAKTYTNNQNTVVANNATGFDSMRFSTSNGKIWSEWEKFATTKSIKLPAPNGKQFVLGQFANSDGTKKATCSDSIIVDTTKPFVKIL